ncbi:glycosyltransferase family 4 protein [Mariniflexile sp.]|uniref:glycosyltransferase family 4 protein n=1 Tax=Mariniflexile sp. TaxID=1979402 RepID=UPI0035684B82
MNFLILSHAFHKTKDTALFSYAPFVREMNIWLKYVDTVEIVAPFETQPVSKIEMAYQHENLSFCKIPSIEFTSVTKILESLLKLPIIFFRIFKACQRADHIHLRCPGNIGLLGCVVQIFFPKKIKTAKYAGNWDPRAKQPVSYKIQKWILSNTFLTRNIQVLVYGNWEQQSKNIKPFFTATYSNSEIEKPRRRNYLGVLKFVYTGSLVAGKRPLLAIQIVEALHKQGKRVHLDVYGDGVLKKALQHYIAEHKLDTIISLHGNQSKDIIKETLKTAHFSILASKSEGWPKAIAEAMFFGTIPIASAVSCVPFMLDFGKRGILIDPNLTEAINSILNALKAIDELELMSEWAAKWSQNYTLYVFENEISKLINPS